MSAVMTEIPTTSSPAASDTATWLDFPATRAMPRKLIIEVRRGLIFVHMYPPGRSFIGLAGGSGRIERASLHATGTAGNPCLFIGSDALFRLTAAEAAEVERVLGPLGLRIDRSEPRSC